MAICATAILDRYWSPETRQNDRLHISERLLNLQKAQCRYLLSLEARLGVHF
jgi:hypothetical protein